MYDVTQYIRYHPGGKKILLGCGKECRPLFGKNNLTQTSFIPGLMGNTCCRSLRLDTLLCLKSDMCGLDIREDGGGWLCLIMDIKLVKNKRVSLLSADTSTARSNIWATVNTDMRNSSLFFGQPPNKMPKPRLNL